MAIVLYNQSEIQKMRDAGRLTAEVFALLHEHIRPGVTTRELDTLAERHIRKHGAVPAYKGYKPRFSATAFPATICASVNSVVCHGFPDDTPLKDGDIVGVDIGLQLNGFYGDSCVTYGVGVLPPETARLLEVTKESMWRGINAAQPGNRIGDIGAAIQGYVEPQGFSVVREWTGHGVGRKLHEDLTVPHVAKAGTLQKIMPGMIFTVEPMVNMGRPEQYVDRRDGWTVRTSDGSLSAQYEHAIAITEHGPEVLTQL
ncbi:type I methionyl aminopeptidase [Chloroflexia bacterium SDU3-3]|nr:type I methionyl aminopeptidase [Chloroflexia bacterium SDU3-3]